MKNPDDLDEFSEEQIEVTRAMEGVPKGRDRIIHFALMLINAIDSIVIKGGLSPRDWQRACYEASQKAKNGDHADAEIAEMIWHVVVYVQSGTDQAKRAVRNIPLKEEMMEHGIKLPDERTD